MIYLTPSAVMMINGDGTKTSFDSEELQTKLINSCVASGIKEYWIAEDITNAVESALSFQSENGIVFSEGEVNSFILKILEDTGFPEIAECFKNNNKIKPEKIEVDFDTLKKLFESRFALKNKDLLLVAERTLNACEILKIKEAEPSLLIELGRHYKSATIKAPDIETLFYKSKISESPWVLSVSEMTEVLSQEARFFIDNGVVSLSGISSLFPSLKVDIRLEAMAELYDLKPIITELLLFPYYKQSADAVCEVIKKVSRHLKIKNIIPKEKTLPVYLRFSDIYSFAEKYLGACYPERENFCWDTFVAGFVENINHPVFIKGLKKSRKKKA